MRRSTLTHLATAAAAVLLGSCTKPDPPIDAAAASDDAVRKLIERGHEVYPQLVGSGTRGITCSLVTPLQEDRKGKLSAIDARLLSQIVHLDEIRVLPSGGPTDEFWDALGEIETVREFAPHYGLNEKGVRSLAKFPNLESLVIWGSDTWGQRTVLANLPDLPRLRVLHLEGCDMTLDDLRRIKAACPALVEFLCDDDLSPNGLHLLRSIPTLKNLSAFNFEMQGGRVVELPE